eukprot:764151-Hanusia_phi.AAC.4
MRQRSKAYTIFLSFAPLYIRCIITEAPRRMSSPVSSSNLHYLVIDLHDMQTCQTSGWLPSVLSSLGTPLAESWRCVRLSAFCAVRSSAWSCASSSRHFCHQSPRASHASADMSSERSLHHACRRVDHMLSAGLDDVLIALVFTAQKLETALRHPCRRASKQLTSANNSMLMLSWSSC